jgi:hypothetical protein
MAGFNISKMPNNIPITHENQRSLIKVKDLFRIAIGTKLFSSKNFVDLDDSAKNPAS